MLRVELLELTLPIFPESSRWDFLHQLGIRLLVRFQRTHRIDDLNWAITIEERALELIPNEDPNHAGILTNLGIALQSRFERTGSMEDLDRAIEKNEQAVESATVDHPNRAMYLNNLGKALQSRFERTESAE